MTERRLDKNTAESELEDADFGTEADSTTFADEQAGTATTTRDEAVPEGRGGEGGMDMPRSAPD